MGSSSSRGEAGHVQAASGRERGQQGDQQDREDVLDDLELELLAGHELGIVEEQAVEGCTVVHVGKCRHGALVAEKGLRRHDDERLANVALQLPAQDVEVVGGRGAVGDLPIVLGAELEIALEPRRAVLGPLALVAVRQQHHETAALLPFVLARRDILIDDDLCTV